MALPMLRGCYRFSSTSSLTRLFFNEWVILNRPRRTRLPASTAAGVNAAVRPFGTERGGNKPNRDVVVIGLTNPFVWFRTQFYCFLIRSYFDREFNLEEFTKGAVQAVIHVSKLLSKCQFEALEGLVAKELIGKLEEKCNLLPSSYKEALFAELEMIMHISTVDVRIFYDDDDRKFATILMRLWYLTNARIPEDALKDSGIFQMAYRRQEDGEIETKSLVTANYEFQREFTQGVTPDWTITRLEHSRLLE